MLNPWQDRNYFTEVA